MVAPRSKVQPPGAGKAGRGMVGSSRSRHKDVSTGRGAVAVFGGLGVALPCALAKRSRLFREVFDDCSTLSRRLSLREKAIIREMSGTIFAHKFLQTGGIVVYRVT